LWEAISDRVPDRPALIQGSRRYSWRQFDDRAARLAGALAAAGVGQGAKVGQLLYNSPEFVESYYAALKLRAVPFNINYRYTADEVAYLLDNADADALVYHSSLSDVVARASTRSPTLKLLIEVDDGGKSIAGSQPYESAIAGAGPAPRIERSPDDVTMIYTGGTTGMPKGVVTRVGPPLTYLLETVAPLVGRAPVAIDAVPGLVVELEHSGDIMVSLPACPLVHQTAMALGMAPALAMGGTIVLLEGPKLDVAELWDLVSAERVNAITIVGDAFARPMLAELDANPDRDITCVRSIASSGAMFSNEVKTRLLAHLPQAMIVDMIGASEGTMGMSISTAGALAETGRFQPNPGVIVITEDGRRIQPGTDEVGLVALPGGGDSYYKDEARSAATFKEIDGRRYTIPGDYVHYEADGSLTLLGRGSGCINTAGEKVFPEEVEEVIKAVPGIEDCLVFGIPDERLGQRVVAVVSHATGAAPADEEILSAARQRLASYKLPRTLVVVDQVPRTQVGKADYSAARAQFDVASDGLQSDRGAS
jgi:fatty-acyl-CoA synthase